MCEFWSCHDQHSQLINSEPLKFKSSQVLHAHKPNFQIHIIIILVIILTLGSSVELFPSSIYANLFHIINFSSPIMILFDVVMVGPLNFVLSNPALFQCYFLLYIYRNVLTYFPILLRFFYLCGSLFHIELRNRSRKNTCK